MVGLLPSTGAFSKVSCVGEFLLLPQIVAALVVGRLEWHGGDVSVELTVFTLLSESQRMGDVHQLNYYTTHKLLVNQAATLTQAPGQGLRWHLYRQLVGPGHH